METVSLACNNCGAPLSVPDSAKFVTCNHCDSRLVIRRNQSATFTEKLDQIEAKTDQLTDVVTDLARQNEVAKIDRRWESEKQSYFVPWNHDRKYLLSEFKAIVYGGAIAGCGILGAIIAIRASDPWITTFALMTIAWGIVSAKFFHSRAKDYHEAEQRYAQRRMEALCGVTPGKDRGKNKVDEILSNVR